MGQLHHQQDRQLGGCEPVTRPGRSEVFLLPSAGSEVPGVFSDWPPFQDQANLSRQYCYPSSDRLQTSQTIIPSIFSFTFLQIACFSPYQCIVLFCMSYSCKCLGQI